MVARLDDVVRIKRISGVALSTIATIYSGMRRICHIKLTRRILRTRLEAQITVYRVIWHIYTQPNGISFMTRSAITG